MILPVEVRGLGAGSERVEGPGRAEAQLRVRTVGPVVVVLEVDAVALEEDAAHARAVLEFPRDPRHRVRLPRLHPVDAFGADVEQPQVRAG